MGALDDKDFTAGTNNVLHSLLSQCIIDLNGLSITQSTELYHYRAYLETILTYGTDAAASHLTNAYRYLDYGYMLLVTLQKLTRKTKDSSPDGTGRNKAMRSNCMVGFIVVCNVPQFFLLPGVMLQIKLKKAKSSFFLMNTNADSKASFKFLEAKLRVKDVKPNPAIILAHTVAQGASQGIT